MLRIITVKYRIYDGEHDSEDVTEIFTVDAGGDENRDCSVPEDVAVTRLPAIVEIIKASVVHSA